MVSLYVSGLNTIIFLQSVLFQGAKWAHYMLAMSHLGDPRNAFIIYFPVTYCIDKTLGRRVLWAAALSEWVNSILKWFLHDDRPYWWVDENEQYAKAPLLQFSLTCEIGPGSPSGHAMVTGAVLCCVLYYFIRKARTRLQIFLVTVLSVNIFFAVMLLIGVSRVYIATHFPHQVVLGVVIGFVIGVLVIRSSSPRNDTLHHHVFAGTFLITSAAIIYYLLTLCGVDPLWSIEKAKRSCVKPEYVHIRTSVFTAILRDSGAIIGVGIASKTSLYKRLAKLDNTFVMMLFNMAATLAASHIIEMFHLPEEPHTLYYASTFLKNMILSYVVIALAPFATAVICFPVKFFDQPNESDTYKEKAS